MAAGRGFVYRPLARLANKHTEVYSQWCVVLFYFNTIFAIVSRERIYSLSLWRTLRLNGALAPVIRGISRKTSNKPVLFFVNRKGF